MHTYTSMHAHTLGTLAYTWQVILKRQLIRWLQNWTVFKNYLMLTGCKHINQSRICFFQLQLTILQLQRGCRWQVPQCLWVGHSQEPCKVDWRVTTSTWLRQQMDKTLKRWLDHSQLDKVVRLLTSRVWSITQSITSKWESMPHTTKRQNVDMLDLLLLWRLFVCVSMAIILNVVNIFLMGYNYYKALKQLTIKLVLANLWMFQWRLLPVPVYD